jgi:anion-transporting  ArsA/GET3 family ATPase
MGRDSHYEGPIRTRRGDSFPQPHSLAAVSALLDRRLIFVTGKGGVGKTTVSAALGLVAARAGRRVLICEVAAQERITAAFGLPPTGFEEVEIEPGLSAFSANPDDSIREWLYYQLRSRTLAGLVSGNRIFGYLAAAAPGLAELVTIGKLWELAQLDRKTPRSAPYDLVIVDAPATGHGLALLQAPRTFAEIARVGPIHRQAQTIDAFLHDPAATAVVAVTLAEEMPVSETIDLERRLADELGIELESVLVNAVLPQRLDAANAKALEAVDGGSRDARRAIEASLATYAAVRGQRAQLGRLRRAVAAGSVTLAHLMTPDVGREDLDRLADALERKL